MIYVWLQTPLFNFQKMKIIMKMKWLDMKLIIASYVFSVVRRSRPSYLYNGNSYIDETAPLYWNSPQMLRNAAHIGKQHQCLSNTNVSWYTWFSRHVAILRLRQTTFIELRCSFTYTQIYYRKTSNIRRTLVGNKIVDHSDVVGASPVGAAKQHLRSPPNIWLQGIQQRQP